VQIDEWLANHPEYVDKYIIVDDDSDMLPHQKPFFVKTDGREGFCFAQYERAVEILDKQQEGLVANKNKEQQPLTWQWKLGLISTALILYTATVLSVAS
jgi:hypothetical protein